MNRTTRVLILFVFLILSASAASAQSDPILPDRAKTPGDTLPVTKDDVCTCNYTMKVRSVTNSVKRQVFADYSITPTPGGYEVDHLISLELGGSNDPKNLWPETHHGPNNVHVKDKLENKLHRLGLYERDQLGGDAEGDSARLDSRLQRVHGQAIAAVQMHSTARIRPWQAESHEET